MDEIFDRIKAAKVNRKYLFTSLILTELLGILVLVWFLKSPLYQKYLTSQPKAYSLSEMNNEARYLVAQGDHLTNQANPNNKIVVLLRSGTSIIQKARIIPDSTGKWSLQIPQNFQTEEIIFTVGLMDQNNRAEKIDNYRLRIISNNFFNLKEGPQQTILEEITFLPEDISTIASDQSTPDLSSEISDNVVSQTPKAE